MDNYILAIETSCDETAAAIIKNGTEITSNVVSSQIESHKRFGGVVPEIASRHHVEQVTIVLEEALKQANMTPNELTAVAVTEGPGLVGALLIGINAAKAFAFVHGLPLIGTHHIAGHIYANNLVERISYPVIALVVSGGHTELIYMKEDYSFEKIGGTLDDAIGEAYDKVARVMGINYPGGPEVDRLAHIGIDSYKLPVPLDDNSYNFSFSGIKSAVMNLVNNERQKGNDVNVENLATSFQNRIVEIIVKKTMKALKDFDVHNLIVAGGVSANKGLREALSLACIDNGIHLCVPEIKFCTDNAAMIGAAAYPLYLKGRFSDIDINAKASDKLN